MNTERRVTITLCVALIDECRANEEISETSYTALGESIKLMQKAEYWSLRNMSKHVDKNDSTARQVAIAEVSLPLIEKAAEAWAEEDLDAVAKLLLKARDAAPVEPKKKRKGK